MTSLLTMPSCKSPSRWVARTRHECGATLLEALIALTLLSFGLLGMASLQANMIAQSTASGHRLSAAALADELLNLALVDPSNVRCYTVPQSGACGSAKAGELLEDWQARVGQSLVLVDPPQVTYSNAGVLRVNLSWRHKDSERTHELEAMTHVQP